MINPHYVDADLAHQRQIGVDLFRLPEIISFCVRLERSVGNPFKKKLLVALEKEFRDCANARVGAHSGSFLVHAADSCKVDRPLSGQCQTSAASSPELASRKGVLDPSAGRYKSTGETQLT